jgi:MFS family permease
VNDLKPSERRAAATMLVLARIVYAFNWYNVGAVLPSIGTGLGANTEQLGIAIGAFLVGAGLFQVPAGLWAIRHGYRATSIFALALMGIFCVLSAVSPNWEVLALTRFGAGAGAAFFFAPALGLVSSYYPVGSRGPVIGVYNAGFSIGSGIGLFGGALIGAAFGWPWALAVGGICLLIVCVGAALSLPPLRRTSTPMDWKGTWSVGRPILRSRNLWALSLGMSGIWAAFYIIAAYFIQFAHAVHPEWPVAIAAGVPTVMIATEVIGGPIGGWFAERRADMRRILLVWSIASGAGLVLLPFFPLVALWPLVLFLGFADGVLFAVLYLIPTYLPEGRGENTALAIGFVNSVNLFVGSLCAILFAVIAGSVGYDIGWVFAAALTVGFLPLLLLVNVPRSGSTDADGGVARS